MIKATGPFVKTAKPKNKPENKEFIIDCLFSKLFKNE